MLRVQAFIRAVGEWWAHIQAMGPMAIAVNSGLTAAIVVAAMTGRKLARFAICRAFARMPEESEAERKRRVHKTLKRTHLVIDIVICLVSALAIASLWGIDIATWGLHGAGLPFTSTAFRLAVVVGLTALGLEVVGLISNRTVKRLRDRSTDPRRTAQLKTLGPIIRRVAQTVIVVVATMTGLSQVGVQIAPLLSAAGIVGIAVGFGAQTLVKDVFTGMFLLVEDIVAIGDVVQIQTFSGEVEDMTLRTIRLRDADGTLHIFPYGESQIIHNMTKTFSFAAIDLPVKADTDLALAMQLMRATAASLKANPDYSDKILAPIEIAGVDLLSDIGTIIKARIRTVPNERWRVLRAFNLEIKNAFDKAGIVITHK